MSDAGLVSVVMPVYAVEAYVGDAIRSVLAQSWPHFELIVVDDGSPDATFSVVQSFDDPRLRPLRLPRNQGVAAARNAALERARGDIIAFIDGDDVMHPTRLERQLAFLRRRPDVALCGGWCRTLGPHPDSPQRVGRVDIDPEAVNASLVFSNVFCTSSLTMRRAALPPGGFRQRYAEDYDFLVRVAARHRLAIMREVVVDYRLRPGSAMQTYALEAKKRDVWESQQPLFEALKVVPSAAERELHLFARTNAGGVDCERLVGLHRWYERLVRANRRSRVYADEAFRLAASHMWFEQLYRATGCGTEALRLFFSSPLTFAHPQPLLLHAKFLAKALARRGFQAPLAPSGAGDPGG
ncbi:MAG: glycosyltransferase family 2 protein [Ignavibacteria bacterium]